MTRPDKKPDLLSDLFLLKGILKETSLRPSSFTAPVVLALGTGVFEGLSLWLLVSLAKGMMGMNFLFVRELPYLRVPIGLLPGRITESSSALFIGLVSLVFAAFVMKNVMQYGSSYTMAGLVRRFGNNIRKLLLSRFISFGKFYFDRTGAGYMENVLMGFTAQVAGKMTDLQQFFANFFLLAAYLGTMCYISWKLTLLCMLVFPLMNYCQVKLIQKIRANSSAYVDAHGEMSRKLYNILACILLVKSYGMETREHGQFSRVSDRVESYELSMDKKLLMIQPVQEIIVLALLLFLISAMTLVVAKNGAAMLPGLMIYFYVIRRATTSFSVISHMKATLAAISGPIQEILEVLDDAGKHFVPEGSEPFPGLSSRIEFSDLKYSYPEGAPILKGVTFTVEKGKMTALVGPSGTGKTTIVNLLSRFYECPAGSIRVDGRDIGSFTSESLRHALAIVSQDVQLLNDTVGANIKYGLDDGVPNARLNEAIDKARLRDFVSKLPQGLETNVGDRGVQLSGGEKQRVSICRALLKEAEILILDEATSALDSRTEKLIQEAIDDMIVGKTAIVIAHRLSTIKKADKIVVLEGGRVMEEGRLAELLERKGLFHQYWEDQKFY